MLDRLDHKEFWVGNHLLAQREITPASDLGGVQMLSSTKKVVLGKEVTCISSHNPLEITCRIVILDHVVPRRLDGASSEESPLGIPRSISSPVCRWLRCSIWWRPT